MPYRRLPNTDNSRMKALKNALRKGQELPPLKLAFSQQTFNRVKTFVPYFEKAIQMYKSTYDNQVRNNKAYLEKVRKAKLFISHFIQVVNMSIMRGEMNPNTRTYLGIEDYENKVPPLNTESSVIEWGKRLIEGEEKRKMNGLSPVTNPTIALVKVRYDQFLDAYRFQKTLQKDKDRTLNNLAELREQADDIILNIWNEVEETFNDLPNDSKRRKSVEYGLVYVYRRNEIQHFNSMNIFQQMPSNVTS
jgi:hypothetical protein